MCLLQKMKQSKAEMKEFDQIIFCQCKHWSWQYDSSSGVMSEEFLNKVYLNRQSFRINYPAIAEH